MEGVPQTTDMAAPMDPTTLKERQQESENVDSLGEEREAETEKDLKELNGIEQTDKDGVMEKKYEEHSRIPDEAGNGTTEKVIKEEGDTEKASEKRQEVQREEPGLIAQAPLVHPEISSASASPRHDSEPVQEYHLKWIDWNDRKTPIVTQNENGPCPLIAILNVLLLRGVIEIPTGVEIVTANQLFNYLGNTLIQRIPKDASEAVRKNFEKNMNDAMEIVSKLQTGLDVNVRFTGVKDFEYTQECLIFDLLNIGLYHGWLYDPQNTELISAVGTCSYNQLVEKIIESKNSSEEMECHQGLVAESFLQSSAAQLTYHGLCELNSMIQNNQLCVLFRNNHFSTLCKHDDILYILVTDQGFLTASNVAWESLSNVEGDSLFYDGSFQRCMPDIKPVEEGPPMSTEQQIDTDFLVALSMQEEQEGDKDQPPCQPLTSEAENLSDQELAMRLQQEEDMEAARMVQEQERAAAGQQQQGARQQQPAGNGRPQNGAEGRPPQPQQRQNRRGEPKDKSCSIL
ncbi:Ubiquitin carboxyl-terminal hydrolase MINDY-1 [Holothuria leucospilota]|uniref:Ubiquitin carboxyl-terminal hydrolase n=1 Tax=Holothuria leucospilota TaxID=206669 RepID=A0A9Q1HK87_HOLLE|nr:Ubiquitin carboxyl-terminal hydrolase MINDY-1 [Holothuria leucospilota]